MKRACIKLNTNTDEQNASSIRPLKINFVRMKSSIKQILSISIAIFLFSCSGSEMELTDDFGAYYSKVITGEDWETYDRTGDYADIIVDYGKQNGKFIFWRGSSYLPYWEPVNGEKVFVDEIIERSGDGTETMPDKTNTYSRVSLIENTPEKVVVHWRYLPEFSGTNPHLGVLAVNFVDEYFYIYPDGKVERTIRKGTQKIDEWTDPLNIIKQNFTLSSVGIKDISLEEAKKSVEPEAMEGNPIVAGKVAEPVAWFKLDEGTGDETMESIGPSKIEILGDKSLWKKGISGTALQFDGYKTAIKLEGDKSPKLTNAITLEGWVAIGAYPWSWCPIIQQADDVPEEVRLFRGDLDITDLEKREGDLSVALVGGDPENQEGDVDVEIEMDFDEMEFEVKYQKEDDKGYFLGINGHGYPGFKIRVGGVWEELTSDFQLERKLWYHLAATYDQSTGQMIIFVNGKEVSRKSVAKAEIEMSLKDIQIGKGKERRPTDPVRENTFPGDYSLDGLIDEVKIYDVALSQNQISELYDQYNPETKVDIDKRILPRGEDKKQFGAYYTNLKYYDIWDNLWRFSEHPDVVVEFDSNPCKFIFWRGVSYIPMMVNENGFWYSNEFNETWSTSGGEGCQEPMSDKECFYNHARIIENTPARVVVHYRFPLADVNKFRANYVEETGWYDVADWYYYIYPDGVAVKNEHLWTSGERIHEWQESMAIIGPDQHPHDLIERKATFTMLRIDGAYKEYDWNPLPPDGLEYPENANIQHINFKGEYDPVTIGEGFEWTNVYGGEITEYAIFPNWNHWPVAQMPSDGRYASYSDRTSHSSLSHLYPPNFKEQFGNRPFAEKLFMEGMLNKEPLDLIPLAKSWLQAPLLSGVKGCTGAYEKSQRAYIFEAESAEISMEILCNEDKPLVNACFVFKHWGKKEIAKIKVDGNEGKVKQGLVRDTDGSYTLVVWLEMESITPIHIALI